MANFATVLPRSLAWRLHLVASANRAVLRVCHGNPLLYFKLLGKSYRLYREHGFLPDETLRLGLWNGNDAGYVSKNRLLHLQAFYNHPSQQWMTEDKASFYTICTKIGLPVPRLLGLFFRDASGIHWGKGAITGRSQWVDFFENHCPDEFVVKPSLGVYGDGIVFVDKKNGSFTGEKLLNAIETHPRYRSFVIQECLANHPGILALSPKKGLQTIRISTFVHNNLTVEVLTAILKLIVGDNRIDNISNGATGNVRCPVDIATGELGTPVGITKAGPKTLSAHPDTGEAVAGKAIPLWPEVLDLAKKAALSFLPMRTIGWDIAVTPGGARIIEGNSRWDPPVLGGIKNAIRVLEENLPRS